VRKVGERSEKDVERFKNAEDELIAQIRSRFGHADGTFGEGSQTSLAFACALGLGDAEALASRLASSIMENDGILSAGIFGSSLAYEILDRYGHDDAIERWLLREDDPSLLHMLSNGNKALAEQYHTFLSSFDHAMFSSYVQWFYQGLAGIHVDGDAVGCDRVTIRPYLSDETDHVDASFKTVRGTIRVRWEARRRGRGAPRGRGPRRGSRRGATCLAATTVPSRRRGHPRRRDLSSPPPEAICLFLVPALDRERAREPVLARALSDHGREPIGEVRLAREPDGARDVRDGHHRLREQLLRLGDPPLQQVVVRGRPHVAH
jgi:hypothetical protein